MSKYKVGDKVVMKIISADQDEIKTYSVSGVNNDWRWCLPQNLLERYIEPLSTYTEPLEAKIRRQAAEITRLLEENMRLKPNYENIRAKGQNEAWELVRKIGNIPYYEAEETFGIDFIFDLVRDYTYSEAAAKVAGWEKAKEKICVGDVVRVKENNSIEFCVTQIGCNGYLYGVGRGGATYSGKNPEYWEKTGRHIDIDSFLKQIGGEQE